LVCETPIMELRNTAGRIQKKSAEKAMLCASTLIKKEVLDVLAVIFAMATAMAPTKKPWATIMGRKLVDRSAARASAVKLHSSRNVLRLASESSIARSISLGPNISCILGKCG
jgi:hypothetical protein